MLFNCTVSAVEVTRLQYRITRNTRSESAALKYLEVPGCEFNAVHPVDLLAINITWFDISTTLLTIGVESAAHLPIL